LWALTLIDIKGAFSAQFVENAWARCGRRLWFIISRLKN